MGLTDAGRRRPGQAALPREGRVASCVPWVRREDRGTAEPGPWPRALQMPRRTLRAPALPGEDPQSRQVGFCAPCRPLIGRRRRVHGPLHSAVRDRDGPRVGVMIPSPEDLPPQHHRPWGTVQAEGGAGLSQWLGCAPGGCGGRGQAWVCAGPAGSPAAVLGPCRRAWLHGVHKLFPEEQ